MGTTRSIRNGKISAFALGIITGNLLTVGVLLLAAPAKADPTSEVQTAICSSLDQNPTVPNVVAILADLVNEFDLTPYQAGSFAADTVITHCSRNLPVLNAFVEQYSPKQAERKQMGGRVA